MGCDSINDLPDPLLTLILSYLPTKDSVKTSALSKRWEFLWFKVPGLDVDAVDFPGRGQAFQSFVDKFLDFNQEVQMKKFKICGLGDHRISFSPNRFRKLICATLKLGIQDLYVQGSGFKQSGIPQNIYKSSRLVSLTIVGLGMEDPKSVVSLPCLKIMRLENIWYDDDSLIYEKLVSGCPVLEQLTLISPFDDWDGETVTVLRVRSQTLKCFHLLLDINCYDTGFSVEIEAPRLEKLTLTDYQSDVIVVKNLTSLSEITVNSDFHVKNGSPLHPGDLRKRDIILDFLTGVSSVRRMDLTQPTLETLYRYSSLGPIPKFENLTRLVTRFFRNVLQFLPVLLESCPNLKYLTVICCAFGKPKRLRLSSVSVPLCLSTTLEYVEIVDLVREDKNGTRLVNYFRENSAVLKKLSVSFRDSPMPKRLMS